MGTSLAEICAVYPTAGGVYYWAALLSNDKWGPIASWITGWLYLVGNWMSTCSIAFGGAQLILSAPTLFSDEYTPTAVHTILTFWAVLLVCMMINIFGVKLLDKINQACIWWTGVTVIATLVVLLAMCKEKRSVKFVFTHFDASASGWSDGWSFCISLLQGAFTLTGYGMIAVMCEEVQNAEREVPRAMVLSVVASGFTGIVYLLAILFVLPEIAPLIQIANGGQPIGNLFRNATDSPVAGVILLLLVIGIMLFACIGAMATASRCAYALARDKAIPGYRYWRRVDERFETPLLALFLTVVVIGLLGLIYLGSSAAFNAFTGATAICLSAAFVSPVAISVIQGRKDIQNSPYPLGKFGWAMNIISVVWVTFSILLYCMPVSLPVTLVNMNYASVVFCGFAGISVVWYYAEGRKSFSGPPMRGIPVVHARDPQLGLDEGCPTMDPKKGPW
ncbi:amino acid permease-like protein [Penicillium angulare]|uniref:Amino acid permease-like protein n=1 Tax=Penicillium angulare TaxID=116970 RepID=A0A9W9ESW7_9EURO|nr:amino acid permease-like protein [Penicillium angulare]